MGAEQRDATQRYIAAVERMRASKRTRMTPSLRDAIARELGLTEADLQRVRAYGEEQLRRGEKFVRHELWDDAIRVLDEAEALLPDSATVLFALAKAHARRASPADRALAVLRCDRGLEIDPDNPELIALKAELTRGKPRGWAALSRRTRVAIAVSLLGISVGSLGYSLSRMPWLLQFGAARLECPAHKPPCIVERRPPPLPRLAETGIELKLDHAAFAIERSAVALELYGRVTMVAGRELTRLDLTVRLFDAADRLLEERDWELLPERSAPLQRGDSRPVEWKGSVPLLAARVELAVAELHSVAMQGEPLRPAPLQLVVGTAKWPSDARVTAAIRQHHVTLTGAHTSIDGIIEFENRGTRAIKQLAVELVAIDANRRPLGRAVRLDPVLATLPPLLPGERRAERYSLFASSAAVSEVATVLGVE